MIVSSWYHQQLTDDRVGTLSQFHGSKRTVDRIEVYEAIFNDDKITNNSIDFQMDDDEKRSRDGMEVGRKKWEMEEEKMIWNRGRVDYLPTGEDERA